MIPLQTLKDFLDCVQVGALDEARDLLTQFGPDLLRARSGTGNTSLMWACQNGNLDVARFLIEQGVDIHAVNKHGNTALHECFNAQSKWGPRVSILKLLVEHGADINARNQDHHTPLLHGIGSMLYWNRAHEKPIAYLISQGADLWSQDYYEKGPSNGNIKPASVADLIFSHHGTIFSGDIVQLVKAAEQRRDLLEQLPLELGKASKATKF